MATPDRGRRRTWRIRLSETETLEVSTPPRATEKQVRRRGRVLLILGTLIAALMVSAVAGAAVWTDQQDYSPGSVVTISGDNRNGAGYLAGETVDVAVSGPNGWTSSCNAVVDHAGAWSCQITLDPDPEVAFGEYSYTATGRASGVSETGYFTDTVNISFATTGLPAGTSVSVPWSGVNNGGNPISGTKSFNAPGPSLVQGFGDNSTLSCTFPASIVVSGVTYNLTNTPCPFNTGAGATPTPMRTVTGAYAAAATNSAPVVTANDDTFSEGTSTNYSASWTDANSGQTHTCTIDFGDGSGAQTGTISPAQPSISGTCSASHTYADGPNSYTITVSVNDGTASGSDTATATVNNVAPTIGAFAATGTTATACLAGNTAGVSFTVSDPATEAYDPITGTINWGDGNTTNISGRSISESHSYAAGSYTITVSVNDGDSGTDSETQAVSLLYSRTGFLQPINMDGTSNFKLGSTIPVKIKVTDCNGASVGTLVPEVSLRRVGSGSGTVNEPVIVESVPDIENDMRYDASGQQYIYNLSTKRSVFASPSNGPLALGRYELKVSDPTIADVVVQFDILK